MSENTAGRYVPTTTHAAWGSGHPRLLITGDAGRTVHELTAELTRIGSSTDTDITLTGVEPLHATIVHEGRDEYVLTLHGEGETNARTSAGTSATADRSETLRTGAHFTAGGWRFVFARDEYADHGRPYGGRNGGEGAHQRRQPPPPDYERHPSPLPDEVTDAAQAKAASLGTAVLADATADASSPGEVAFELVDDRDTGIYEAVIDGQTVGGVTYNLVGDDRMLLLAVSVLPAFRGHGISTALIRRVLDEVRRQGRTVTNFCPVVATFLQRHPDYADVLNPQAPGVIVRPRT